MDVRFLSRVQFALTIMFHYLFPSPHHRDGGVLVYLEAFRGKVTLDESGY